MAGTIYGHMHIPAAVVRLRGAEPINQRGAWGRSDTFGRCRSCGCLSIRGICQACGWAVVCCHCGRTKQPDGSWRHVPHQDTRDSHGVCSGCLPGWLRACEVAR